MPRKCHSFARRPETLETRDLLATIEFVSGTVTGAASFTEGPFASSATLPSDGGQANVLRTCTNAGDECSDESGADNPSLPRLSVSTNDFTHSRNFSARLDLSGVSGDFHNPLSTAQGHVSTVTPLRYEIVADAGSDEKPGALRKGSGVFFR